MRAVHSDDYMGRKFDLVNSNCWHLVRDVWRDMTGVDLGDLTPQKTDTGALNAAVWDASDGPAFERLEKAQDPCIVLLRKRRDMPHVGVLMRGHLLHITAAGVRYQALAYAALEFSSVEFYVPRSEAA